MSKKKNKKRAAENNFSAAKEEKNSSKTSQESNEKINTNVSEEKDAEWLEQEMQDVNFDEDNASPQDQDNENLDSDELMKRAAKKIRDANEEIKEWQNKYMRLHAEWDTYRRRTAEQRKLEKATATEGLVNDILPVLDDFERSIIYAKENGEDGLLTGVEAVYTKLVSALEKSGVEVLDPKYSEAFNALEHQAVATVQDTDVYDESIASVMQKGYKMGKKVIRPAMVSVTTEGPKRPKEEAEAEDN